MRNLWIAATASAVAVCACVSPGQGKTSGSPTTATDTISFDAKGGADGSDAGKDGGATSDTTSKDGGGGGAVILSFEIDDSANKTFANGEIVWTGSFSWDAKTNTVVYATSWLPTDGPYPPLWDDGPQSAGGHERDGATKGDHVFSTQVLFNPVADTTIEYGALNELGNWMWLGPNGKVEIKKDAKGIIAFPGMKIAKHGAFDVKIALDTAKLNAKFSKWNPKDYSLFVKGTLNMWTPIQLLDDGNKGDAKAGDGVVTYQHLVNLGKHDGGLNAGDEVQFIFVATTGDQLPDAGLEYKGATEAFVDGVQAWTATGPAGSWVAAPIVLSKDSKGKFLNTAFKVPAPSATGGCTPGCKATETCENGKCVTLPPPCAPPCKAGEVCEVGKCVVPQSKPTIASVEPSAGSTQGGDSVTIAGSQFGPDLIVRFDKAAASDVAVSPDGKFATCKTPAHAIGVVDVEVQNVDGGKASLAKGFAYQAPPKPTVTLQGLPTDGKVAIGAGFSVSALVAIPGVTAAPGITADLLVVVGLGPAGSDPDKDGAKYEWKQATFLEEDASGAERFLASMPGAAKGTYALAARATWKGETVYSPTSPLAVVDATDLPTLLTGVTPGFLSALGGTVKLDGVNLLQGFTIDAAIGAGPKTKATAIKPVAGGALVTWPALPLGLYDIAVTTTAGKTLSLAKALDVAPIGTPAGALSQGGWPAALQAAVNDKATNWGVGKNELKALWVAYDKANLYVGVEGTCEPTNAIVVYLDVDYGAMTGAKAPVDLQDNSGAVDDAIASALKSGEMVVALDFAFATVGMASYAGGDPGQSTQAGWRNLSNVKDFAWLGAPVKTSGQTIEATIALATLYPNGIPPEGVNLHLIAVLVNANGAEVSNQFLPVQKAPADAKTWSNLQPIRVYPAL